MQIHSQQARSLAARPRGRPGAAHEPARLRPLRRKDDTQWHSHK